MAPWRCRAVPGSCKPSTPKAPTSRSLARESELNLFVRPGARAPGRTRVPMSAEERTMYIDGFVAAVPTANRDAYRRHAEAAAVVFREHGALRLVECWGVDGAHGKHLPL